MAWKFSRKQRLCLVGGLPLHPSTVAWTSVWLKSADVSACRGTIFSFRGKTGMISLSIHEGRYGSLLTACCQGGWKAPELEEVKVCLPYKPDGDWQLVVMQVSRCSISLQVAGGVIRYSVQAPPTWDCWDRMGLGTRAGFTNADCFEGLMDRPAVWMDESLGVAGRGLLLEGRLPEEFHPEGLVYRHGWGGASVVLRNVSARRPMVVLAVAPYRAPPPPPPPPEPEPEPERACPAVLARGRRG